MFNKTRTIIITVIAALSIVSVGSMASVASAQPKITVQHVEQLCKGHLKGGDAWFSEGSRITVEGHTYECKEGEWKKLYQEETLIHPKTSQEVVSSTPPLANG